MWLPVALEDIRDQLAAVLGRVTVNLETKIINKGKYINRLKKK